MSRASALRIGILVLVLGAVIALFASGALAGFSLERTAALIRSFGGWGVIVFLLAFSLIQPLGVSGHVFTYAAALVWSPWVALGLGLLGALGSALVNVAFVRLVAFDWVQARIPPRIRKYEVWLTDRGLWGVFVFRLFSFTLHPAQLLIAVARVPLSRMILGTLLGFAPHVAVDVFLGGKLLRWVLGAVGLG